MSPTPSFRVRLAELRDVPRVTTVALASLPDDPGFEFIWRYRRQYPDDSQFFWLQVFKHYLYHPKITLIVAEEVASLEEKREDRGEAVATIIAFALWERNGKSMLTQALTNLWSKGMFNALHCEHARANPMNTILSNDRLHHLCGELGHRKGVQAA